MQKQVSHVLGFQSKWINITYAQFPPNSAQFLAIPHNSALFRTFPCNTRAVARNSAQLRGISRHGIPIGNPLTCCTICQTKTVIYLTFDRHVLQHYTFALRPFSTYT